MADKLRQLLNKIGAALSYCNWCGSSSGHESWCSGR